MDELKVTKTNLQYVEEMLQRKIINMRNNKCPCCGKPTFGFTFMRETGGLLGLFAKEEYFKSYSYDRCGTEWESDAWTE